MKASLSMGKLQNVFGNAVISSIAKHTLRAESFARHPYLFPAIITAGVCRPSVAGFRLSRIQTKIKPSIDLIKSLFYNSAYGYVCGLCRSDQKAHCRTACQQG